MLIFEHEKILHYVGTKSAGVDTRSTRNPRRSEPEPRWSEQHRSQTVSLHIKLDFTNDKAKVVPVGSNLQRLRHVFKKHGPGG